VPNKPTPISWPTSSFPGNNPQESGGRLINAYAEPLGDVGPGKFKWIRSPGLSQFAVSANSGYRGGLTVGGVSYETWANDASTVSSAGALTPIGTGVFPGTKKVSIARNQASPTPDVVAVDLDNGAYVLGSAAVLAATATATIGGTTFNTGDVVALTFLNPALSVIGSFPISVSYTLGAAETAITVATALAAAVNANSALAAANLTATSAGAVITFDHQGSIGNQTSVDSGVTGTGNETVTFAPVSGNLAGGQGTFGAFTGNPTLFNGAGNLPEPNSVCFQDGYFFFTIGDGRIFASTINGLTVTALTFITVQAKADVQLLRGIAFSGLLLAFTTGSCEVWQDAAIPAPAFPYSRIGVLETGLIQPNAIAGWDTGFSELIWVDEGCGVQWMTSGGLAFIKISPPDLDRLIEAEVRAGNTLEAGVYITAGKKFWALSSPNWTWEFNLQTKKWNERWSLATSEIYGRWRATGGHPAFGKWMLGDVQSGNLLYIDDTNYTENGASQIWRMESGPVRAFPSELRVARGDFDFVFGVGQAVGSVTTGVTGAAAGAGGIIALAVTSTTNMRTNDVARVSGVVGTVEANGVWQITVIDATHIGLQGSVFTNAYTSGGSVVDLTSPPNSVAPQVAVSMSRNGGLNWGNPLIRSLGAQAHSRRQYVSVSNMGQAGSMGVRWRLDVTDDVYVSFFGGTQSSELRPSER
jgi:hypothetical protein